MEKSAVQWQKARGGRKRAAGAGERKRCFFSELQSEKGLHLRNNPLEHTNRFMIHVRCYVTLKGRHAKKTQRGTGHQSFPVRSPVMHTVIFGFTSVEEHGIQEALPFH